MKNKIISLTLIVALSGNIIVSSATSLGDVVETTSTSGGTWKDDLNGVTYVSFGRKSFKFKNRNATYTPWINLGTPTLNAGCGGIDFNGGYFAFLELDEIGKQLEQSISSLGMGVIVGLLQTLPSIGKAFEQVQKIVRKLQSMLQNSCQLGASLVTNNPIAKKSKETLQGWTDKLTAVDALSGAADKMDEVDKTLKKDPYKSWKWLKDAMSGGDKEDKKGNQVIGLSSNLGKSIIKNIGKEQIGYKSDTLKNVLDNKKIGDISIELSQEEKFLYKLMIATFGAIAVEYTSSVKASGMIEDDGKANTEEMSKKATESTPQKVAQYSFVKPKNEPANIAKFFTGDLDLNYIDNFLIEVIASSSKVTKAGQPKGNIEVRVQLVEPQTPHYSTITNDLTIYESTKQSIMHVLLPEVYTDDGSDFPVLIPNGSRYVSIIKKFADKKDYEFYADILAKRNTAFTIQNLLAQVHMYVNEIQHNESSESLKSAVEKFNSYAEEVIRNIEEVEITSGDDLSDFVNLEKLFSSVQQKGKIKLIKNR